MRKRACKREGRERGVTRKSRLGRVKFAACLSPLTRSPSLPKRPPPIPLLCPLARLIHLLILLPSSPSSAPFPPLTLSPLSLPSPRFFTSRCVSESGADSRPRLLAAAASFEM